jgi:hypothetical protein
MGAKLSYKSFFGPPLLSAFARNTVYQAGSDGFVNIWSGFISAEIGVYIQVNTTNPPTAYRGRVYESSSGGYRHLAVPILRGEYWVVSSTYMGLVIDWFPHL